MRRNEAGMPALDKGYDAWITSHRVQVVRIALRD